MRAATISLLAHRALAALFALASTAVQAAEPRAVATHGDWSLFYDGEVCWVATTDLAREGAMMMSAFKTEGGVEFSVLLPEPGPERPVVFLYRGAELEGGTQDAGAWIFTPEGDGRLHGLLMEGERGVIGLRSADGFLAFSAAGYRSLVEAAPNFCAAPTS